jgi:hypothetical protein
MTEDCKVEDRSLLVHRRWTGRGSCESIEFPLTSHACLLSRLPYSCEEGAYVQSVVNLLFAHPLLFLLARRQEDSRGENRGQGRGPRFSTFLFQFVCVCVCVRARASFSVSLSLSPFLLFLFLSLSFSSSHLEYIFLSLLEFVCIHTHLHSYCMCISSFFLPFFAGFSAEKVYGKPAHCVS